MVFTQSLEERKLRQLLIRGIGTRRIRWQSRSRLNAKQFAQLNPLPGPQSAPPEKPTIIHRDHMRIERIDRLGLELGTQVDSKLHLEEDQPLSAAAELRRTWTMLRLATAS